MVVTKIQKLSDGVVGSVVVIDGFLELFGDVQLRVSVELQAIGVNNGYAFVEDVLNLIGVLRESPGDSTRTDLLEEKFGAFVRILLGDKYVVNDLKLSSVHMCAFVVRLYSFLPDAGASLVDITMNLVHALDELFSVDLLLCLDEAELALAKNTSGKQCAKRIIRRKVSECLTWSGVSETFAFRVVENTLDDRKNRRPVIRLQTELRQNGSCSA